MTTTNTAASLTIIAALENAVAAAEARLDLNPNDDDTRFRLFDYRARLAVHRRHIYPTLPGLAA